MNDTGQVAETTHARGSRLHPRVTSFRSRRGALTAAQQGAWDRTWARIGQDVSDEKLDTTVWFGRDAPLIVEIGSGTGTATAAMAKAEPHVNLIAVEVYRPGLAQLVQQIEREQIRNLRLLRGDAVDVLEHMVEPGSLTGVRVFFPDPWPKSRHHKRRLLQAPTVSLIASRLMPGGVLHVATDHQVASVHSIAERSAMAFPSHLRVRASVVTLWCGTDVPAVAIVTGVSGVACSSSASRAGHR